MKKFLYTFVVIATFLSSCKPKENIVYLSNDNFEQEVSKARYEGLRIQQGDKLQILVSALDEIAVRPFNQTTMAGTASAGSGEQGSGTNSTSSQYTVTAEGTINFPVLGSIFCEGMTKKQLQQDLENRLLRYLTDPMVTVTLANFNFSVLGEVSSPGQKTSTTEKLNIFQALALAGDATYDANRTNVKLIRYSEKEEKDQVVSLDLSEASIINSPYYYIQQNDIIYVEPDKNKQVAVKSNSAVDQWIKYGGVALGLVTLFISLTR
ncbi:polysaccharide export protein [Chryseobacterium sp. H3056]|uniref:Polysaccharide export protein n=1 Tax=Kaistella daneshvariae TaxID=2487074 RepID=A0A3N0WVZ4_9FLAO|nr:polysaccharide biosynthesis/export family protein [Kaistella daneshvariae]ROI09247.1 polysaccharide export protein [Kaistella daneshvariae]